MISRNLVQAALVCAGVVCFTTVDSGVVWATSISYGDFTAATVIYKGVSEASVTDPLPLYGAPTVSVDSLSFNLLGVGAFNIAANSGGFDFVDGQLLSTIQAKPGQKITKVKIKENGDFSLFGVGTAVTNVQVGLAAILRVREIDGLAVDPLAYTYNQNMIFTPASVPNGKYTLPEFPGLTQLWNGVLEFDVDSLIPGPGQATLLDVTFNNSLFAYSQAGSGALIMKKMVDVSTTTVPEPSTLILLVMSTLAVAGWLWRKRSAVSV